MATLLERLPLESFVDVLVQDLRSSLARYGVDGDEQLMEDCIASQTSEEEEGVSSEAAVDKTLPRLRDLEGDILRDLQQAKINLPQGMVAFHEVIAELDSQAGAQAAALAYTDAVAAADRKLDHLLSILLFCGVRLGEHPQSAPLSSTEQEAAHRLVQVLHASRPALLESPLASSLQVQSEATPQAMVARVALRGMLSLREELLSEADMLALEHFYQGPEAEFILQVKDAFGAWTLTACEATTAPWFNMLEGVAQSRAGDDMLGFSNAQGPLQCGRVFADPNAPVDAPALPLIR